MYLTPDDAAALIALAVLVGALVADEAARRRGVRRRRAERDR